jgi:hypothetical protein
VNDFPAPLAAVAPLPAATPTAPPPPARPPHGGRTGLRGVLWRLSHPWVAIALLALVFVHQAVGSAFYTVRQHFEINEMEWFNGPLSLALWTAICCCLASASLVRVPWRWSRIGAHLTQLGVIMMVASCVVYFSTKIEGEVLLLRHLVHVAGPAGASCTLIPNPGASASLALGGGATCSVSIDAILPDWTILSGAHAPTAPGAAAGSAGAAASRAWAIMVGCTPSDGAPFHATLIEGHPELTQFTRQGRQPASYLAAYRTVLADGPSQTLVAITAAGERVLAIPLREHARSQEVGADGERSLEITAIDPDFRLLAAGFQGKTGTLVSWTLRCPQGQESGSSIVDQPTLTRFQQARVKTCPDPRLSLALFPAPSAIGFHQDRPALWVRRAASEAPDGAAPLRPLDPAHAQVLPLTGLPRYHDHGEHVHGVPLAIDAGTVEGVHFSVTAFAPYAQVRERWREEPAAPLNPLLVVTFSSPDQDPITRPIGLASDVSMVDSAALTWLQADDAATMTAISHHLHTLFPDVPAGAEHPFAKDDLKQVRMVFITCPDGHLELWTGLPGQSLAVQQAPLGSDLEEAWWGEAFHIHIDGIYQHPLRDTSPEPVPDALQLSRMTVGRFYSYIEVAATAAGPGGQTVTAWVPYTAFPELPVHLGDTSSSTLGEYQPRPVTIDVPGAGRFELEYSRMPLALPGPMWMTGFVVPRRPGTSDPAEYFCHVGFAEAGEPAAAAPAAPQPALVDDPDRYDQVQAGQAIIHMNSPLEWHGTFFFQANWDPAFQALTVLGVGNRPGGTGLLVSAIVIALGMSLSGILGTWRATRGQE